MCERITALFRLYIAALATYRDAADCKPQYVPFLFLIYDLLPEREVGTPLTLSKVPKLRGDHIQSTRFSAPRKLKNSQDKESKNSGVLFCFCPHRVVEVTKENRSVSTSFTGVKSHRPYVQQ